METIKKVNVEGNYIIELFCNNSNKWLYITTEFSFSVASIVIVNLYYATKQKCRVYSKRTNIVLAETNL